MVALVHRVGAHASEIAAGRRFGHRDGQNLLAADDAGHPAVLLLVGTELRDIGRDQIIMQVDIEAYVAMAHILLDDDLLEAEIVDPRPAIFLVRYISNGILGDLIVVAARTDPNSRHGLGLMVVERGMEGFERGRKLAKMGLKAQDTAELFFNDVKVPKENVLGDPTQGFKYLARFLAQERLVAAIGFMATAQTAFDITLDYVKERRAFGKPIGAFQNTRFKMASMRAELDALQTYVDQCVLLLNAGELTPEDASAAKLLTSELEGRVMDECVQLHGGAGYMEEYRISRMYTDARISRIFAGTSEIMREIIGRGLGLDERKLS